MNKRVLILGAHQNSGHSMRRYSALLEQAYIEAGRSVTVLTPKNKLSSRTSSTSAKKWIAYLENFLAFPPTIFLKSRAFDLVHIPDHSDSPWLLFLWPGTRKFVTCHDLFAVRAAIGDIQEHQTRLSGRAYQHLIRRSLLRAHQILCVSSATRSDAQRILKRSASILRNPLDPRMVSEDEVDSSLGDFLLIVSSVSWRKKREDSIRAWLKLRNTQDFEASRLIIVGPPLTELEKRLVGSVVSEINVLSDVNNSTLANLYASSRGLICLSRYEGFCWPIIEAQANGVVPILPMKQVYRDTGGDGAIYIDDQDLESNDTDWQQVARLLQSPHLRALARSNTDRYSWQIFASQLNSLTN